MLEEHDVILYTTLTNNPQCPVCKAGVREDSVIPLYVRGSDNVDPRTRDGNPEMQPNYGSAIPNR